MRLPIPIVKSKKINEASKLSFKKSKENKCQEGKATETWEEEGRHFFLESQRIS